jgi:hypothetical protein
MEFVTLWQQLTSTLHPGERDIIRILVGSDLVERNEDIAQEIHALNEVLDDCEARSGTQRVLPSSAGARLLEGKLRLLLEQIEAVRQICE